MAKKIKQDKNYLKVFFNLFLSGDLTLHDVMVLSLLISYDINNDKDITLTSEQIAKHFKYKIAKKTVDNIISKLERLGYITKSLSKYRYEDSGNYDNKRYIKITPKTYAIINGELPIIDAEHKAESVTNSEAKEITKSIESKTETESKANEIHPAGNNAFEENLNPKEPNFDKSIHPIPKLEITDEKLKWLQKVYTKTHITKEDLESFKEEDRIQLFYGSEGVWYIDKENKENKYLIKIRHLGGSICTVLNLNLENESIKVNYADLNYYWEQKGLKFGDMSVDIYRHIKINGLPKIPKEYKKVMNIS